MLRGDDDGVHRDRPVVLVLDRDLRLAVGTQPGDVSATSRRSASAAREAVREQDRHRHQLVGLVARVAEHHPLVAGAAGVDAHRDVGRLAVDRADHRAGLRVEAERRVGVADALDRLAHDVGHVHVRGRS